MITRPYRYPRTTRYVLLQLRRRSEPRTRVRGRRPAVYMVLQVTLKTILRGLSLGRDI